MTSSTTRLAQLRAQRSMDTIALAGTGAKFPVSVLENCGPPLLKEAQEEHLVMVSGRELAWASWNGVPVEVPATRYRGAPAVGLQVTAAYLPQRTIVTYCVRYLLGASRVSALTGYTYYSPFDPVSLPGLTRPQGSTPSPGPASVTPSTS